MEIGGGRGCNVLGICFKMLLVTVRRPDVVLGVVGCWIRVMEMEFGVQGGMLSVRWEAWSDSGSRVVGFRVGVRSREDRGFKGWSVLEIGSVALLTMVYSPDVLSGIAGCWIRVCKAEFGGTVLIKWRACSDGSSGVDGYRVGMGSMGVRGCMGLAVKGSASEDIAKVTGVLIGGGTGEGG